MSNDLTAIFASNKIVVEPTAEMRDGAINMFQLRQAWLDAGFTPAESLQLLIAAVTNKA